MRMDKQQTMPYYYILLQYYAWRGPMPDGQYNDEEEYMQKVP